TTAPATTLSALLRHNAKQRPEHIAVIDGGKSLTYAQLLARCEGLAYSLRARGVRRGTRVGLLQCNRAGMVECIFAIALAGGVVVPFSTWSTVAELSFLLADSQVAFVLAQEAFNGRDLKSDLLQACEKSGLHQLA